MTMLYSLYTGEGITFAADSRISGRAPGQPTTRLESQEKILSIPLLGAASEGGLIGCFGLAQVNKTPMDAWLKQRVIATWHGSAEARDFATHLVNALSERNTAERKQLSGFHIVAFEYREGVIVPVFFIVCNGNFDESIGKYRNVQVDYNRPDEHFIRRDLEHVAAKDVRAAMRAFQRDHGFPLWYRNGDLPRFGPIASSLESALQHLVSASGSHFRAPIDNNGWNRLAKTLIVSSIELYSCYYDGPIEPVGEEAVVKTVNWP